jgi:tetratricopeptide (TPR) repeat protein
VDADSLFLRGKEAADSGNYDYAIAIFLDILKKEPEHLKSLRALRGCEMAKFQEGGSSAKVTGMLKGMGSLLGGMTGGKPEKQVRICEKYLVNDPTNISVLLRLGRAYEKLGYMEAATDTLEFARQRKPDHVGVLRQLADICRVKGDYEKALRCMREIVKLKPNDRNADQDLRRLSAEAHITETRIDKAKDFTEVLRDKDQSAKLEKEQHVARTDGEKDAVIDAAQTAAEANPEDEKAQRNYGDALFNSERFKEAEEVYKKEFGLSKRFPARERVGDARRRRLIQIERALKQQIQDGDKSSEMIAKYKQACKQRVDFCVKETAFRCQHHPTDLSLAYQLGQYYFERGGGDDIQAAIKQFQRAQGGPSLRTQSRLMLARCFRKTPATLDMARDTLETSVTEAEENTDMWKQLVYELASILEQLDDASGALGWFKKIYAVDAGYKDVSGKVTALS